MILELDHTNPSEGSRGLSFGGYEVRISRQVEAAQGR